MRREIRDQWTAALRSGEYQQAKNYLRTAQGYCCLGVLCELAVKAGVIPPAAEVVQEYEQLHYLYGDDLDSNSGALPEAVMQWAGIDEAYGEEVHLRMDWWGDEEEGQADSLASKNDGGMSFPEIADLIEETF